MPLIVETGSGLTNSNSFVAVADADTYWSDRNNSTWAAATTPAKTAALLEAAQFIEYTYRFIGQRVSSAQALAWPRYVEYYDDDYRAVASNSVPQRVKDAQCELALEALSSRLLASQERGGRVQSESVGPLSTSYFEDAPAAKQYPFVDRILADLVEQRVTDSMIFDSVRG